MLIYNPDVLDQFSSKDDAIKQLFGNAAHTPATSDQGQTSTVAATAAAAKPTSSSDRTNSAKAPRPAINDDSSYPEIDDAFVQNLEQGMAELLASTDAPPDLKAQLEGLLHALDEPASETETQAIPSKGRQTNGNSMQKEEIPAKGAAEPGSKTFQDKIQQTMNRMQDSSTAATSATDKQSKDPSSDPEALLAQLLEQMEAAGLGNDSKASANGGASSTSNANADSAADPLNSMLLNIMSELTHKEILYEPMKELHEKFPKWIARHETANERLEQGSKGGGGKAATAEAVSRDDMQRYKEQQRVVAEIMGRFERPGYSDDNVADREFIVERMQMVCFLSQSSSV